MSDGASVYAKREIFQVNEMNGILAVVAGSLILDTTDRIPVPL